MVQNYRDDKYYPRIVKAVNDILLTSQEVAPIEVFRRMDLLSSQHVNDWRAGRIPYLEKVIRCNLAKANRVLRILQMHAHDLNLGPKIVAYRRGRRGSRQPLRFTKTGDRNLEESYARHFFVIGNKRRRSRNSGGARPSSNVSAGRGR